MNTYKTASMQIEFVSDEDPPMSKSEKKVGEQELNVSNSRILAQSSLTSPISLTSFYRGDFRNRWMWFRILWR